LISKLWNELARLPVTVLYGVVTGQQKKASSCRYPALTVGSDFVAVKLCTRK